MGQEVQSSMSYAHSTCLLLYFLVPFTKPLFIINSHNIALDNDEDLVPFTQVISRLWESHGADNCFKEVKPCNSI